MLKINQVKYVFIIGPGSAIENSFCFSSLVAADKSQIDWPGEKSIKKSQIQF
jgi:hypothetical protein